MSSLTPPEYSSLLRELRAQRRREEFQSVSLDFAARHPRRALRFCLPRAPQQVFDALRRLSPKALTLRPCFGDAGATLTLRTSDALRPLTQLGSLLGPGLARLVVLPGVGTEGLPELLEALPLQALRALRMDGQGIRARRPVVVPERGNLFRLHIAGDDDVISKICALSRLEDLRLADNRIGPAGAHALRELSGLRRLDLRGNAIGDEGAAGIACMESLEDLRLEDNCISEAGALALATLPRLRVLDLRRNPVGQDAPGALASLPTLETLRLSDAEPLTGRPRLLRLVDHPSREP